jgi:hypothetical protein
MTEAGRATPGAPGSLVALRGRYGYLIVAAQNAPPFFSKYCWW